MSRFSLSRWGPGHLLAAWSTYWVGLAAVTLTPVVIGIVRATSGGGPPGTGNVSVNLGDGGLGVVASRGGQTIVERSAGLLSIALWIAVPPLVLWGAWLYARSRELARSGGPQLGGAPKAEALGEPAPELRPTETSRSRERR